HSPANGEKRNDTAGQVWCIFLTMANHKEPRKEAVQNPPEPFAGDAVPPRNRFPWKTIVPLVVLAAIGITVVTRGNHANSEAKAAATAKSGPPPISVVMGTVAEKDVPIYRDGLGTVQAFNTVTVRSRVDGQLQKLSFREGQDVRAGDVLAQIDPAPFKTQVAQAEAKKAQDEAQLAFARIELKRDADLLAIKIVSPEAYDTQKAQVNQFEAAV